MKKRGPAVVIKRKASPIGAPTRRPLRAVIVALDAARTTGFAVYVAGSLHHYGEIDAREPAERRRALNDAITTAEVRGLPLVAVIEVPSGGFAFARHALSLHATVELWRDTWKQLGLRADRLVETSASEWRRELFGRKQLRREQARESEQLVALARARLDLPRRPHHTIGPDASAAICIGSVMVRSSALEALL